MLSPQPQFEEDDIQVQYHPNKLTLEVALTHQQLDQLLNLIHRSKHEDFTLRNRKDVQDTWDAASYKLTPFVKEEVIIPFQGDNKTFQVFYCSIWDWAVDLLQDPQVGPHFVFDAEWLSKFNGDRIVRLIHEPWTANSFWEYQLKIPQDSKPLTFILYADKAKLSSYGHAKGYPVIARCTNLPTAIRNGEGLGGGHVVGWLPIVKEDKKHSGKPAFVNFKNAILVCLAPLSKVGSAVKCWDDLVRVFYPIILTLSADYEEQSVMALICGLMGKFPCPICLVPRNELSKTSNVYPICTSANENALCAWAQESTTLEAKEQILSSESLQNVDNSFDMMEHTNVHRALSHDKLHFNDEGLFSDHQWAKLQKWIEHSGRQAAVLIDNFFNSFLRWQNLNHFDQVVSVSFSDGTKYEDISKATLAMLTELMDVCFIYYILDRQKYIEDTLEICDKSWNFLKKHLSAHLFDDIKVKGVSRNYTTKPNEKMHKYIHGKLDCLDAQNLSQSESDLPDPEVNSDEIDSETKLTDAALHFSLGSQQVTKSFADIEASNTGNLAFVQFRIKLNVFLNHAFNTNGIPFPDGRRVQLAADNMTEVGVIFAQLLLVFTCTVGNDQYPIMLTLPYDQSVGARPQKDKDFDFWQVKAKPRVSTEFFSVQSIICGCVSVEDSSRPNEGLVIDTLDTDMFLHMKEIHINTIAG
ncbi:hypothetical protein DFJ58DRAFT_718051 [Suillus subalutaceus]|uniref:uncharacterized protein n=1 Tax=Suillus subalutaceus TaxID=48586 RepID=UPI001B86EBFB|nr:uncharacterized protein DFJ58DRAFT_718051 [Suillus subalutaceus]KAG1842193.1 hypothetical protein DFJ58DRAFT_718051 [Suillus subalutaceus]